jgi:glutathione S-transferase
MLTLVIGNKNYSSWSMRPWVMLRNASIPFQEHLVRFDSFDAESAFKTSVQSLSPVGKVPVLLDDSLVVWDTLAIAEYVAERFAQHALWPDDVKQRARARSLCAEMHSGFQALRSACPMNIEARLPHIGALVLRDNAAVRGDVARIESLFCGQLDAHGQAFLSGAQPGILDAYFAPVCMRFTTYELSSNAQVLSYIDRVKATVGVSAWINDARAEKDFLAFEEPYRLSREG